MFIHLPFGLPPQKNNFLNFVSWLPGTCGSFHVFPKVQSLGVCVAALCIWLQPLDVGSVWTARGGGGLGSTVDMLLTSSDHRISPFFDRSSKKNNNLNTSQVVSSLSPDFCRIVGQFFCGFQTFLSIQLRPFWCEICQVSKWNYVSWIWLWQLTRSIFNKLNQRISRNSLEILKVFVFFFLRVNISFFSRWKTYSQCVFGPALEKDSKRLFDLTWKNLISDFPERLKIRQSFFLWVKCWWIWRGSSSPKADPMCTCCSVSNGVIKIALGLHSVDESGWACDVQPLYSKKHQVPGNSLWLVLDV